jgi:hypothetical protein
MPEDRRKSAADTCSPEEFAAILKTLQTLGRKVDIQGYLNDVECERKTLLTNALTFKDTRFHNTLVRAVERYVHEDEKDAFMRDLEEAEGQFRALVNNNVNSFARNMKGIIFDVLLRTNKGALMEALISDMAAEAAKDAIDRKAESDGGR